MAYAHVVSVRDFDEGKSHGCEFCRPAIATPALLDSFWICRVSIFSVLSGWFLLYAAPQAQSLWAMPLCRQDQ
jgi:hypothetical protein